MSTLTPGPWRARLAPRNTLQRHQVLGRPHPVDGGDYAPICETALPGDARVMASAPEMLAALEMALPFIPRNAMVYSEGTHGDRVYVADACRAAITKAKAE